MKNFKLRGIYLFIVTIILAIFGHSFYIYRFFQDGTIFTGPNDGLEQMLPMQLYLYDKFKQGQMFYNLDFGFGGDYYTDLAYYYSTSIIFFINMIFVWILDLFFNFHTNTVTFWAKNAFYISIFKSAVGMTAAFYYFKKVKMTDIPALLSAFLFLTSAIYFRFTLYWSFFSDVFIFLPLLLLGIERYIQNEKKGLFIVAVACIFINNFYFAYYQVLFGLIYFLCRNIFKSQYDIVSRTKQWLNFILMTLIGLMISAFAFFYGAKSFIQNDRAPYSQEIPLFSPFNRDANFIYDNYLFIVLVISIQAILTFKFYKHYFYRLFAILSIVMMILSFTPFIDSVFNGFSAPQKRWHYLITFFTSGLIGFYIMKFKEISVQNYVLSLIPGLLVVYISDFYIQKEVTWIWILPIISLIGLSVLIIKDKKIKQTMHWIFIISIIILNWDIIRVHNKLDNYHPGIDPRAKLEYIKTNEYDSDLQRQIATELNKKLLPSQRIDWSVNKQDNAPMYQGFKGLSIYSSIFDGNIVDFYFKELKINLKDEIISKYSGLNSRSNLESLMNVKYLVRNKNETFIPQHFEPVLDYGNYLVYENKKMIPFARITNNVINEKDLTQPLDKEHAMINGIVSETLPSNYKIDKSKNLLNKMKIKNSGSTWIEFNKKLKVNPPSGGLIIEMPKTIKDQYKDFYIDISVELIQPIKRFEINVNKYANNRTYQTSTYRTHFDDLLYRVKAPEDSRFIIAFSDGEYNATINGIYGENYKILDNAKKSNFYPKFKFDDNGNKMKITLFESIKGHLVLPIPYREGLRAKIDGKNVPISKANYVMSSIKVKDDSKVIEISYLPPYFTLMISISLFGLLLFALVLSNFQFKGRKNDENIKKIKVEV